MLSQCSTKPNAAIYGNLDRSWVVSLLHRLFRLKTRQQYNTICQTIIYNIYIYFYSNICHIYMANITIIVYIYVYVYTYRLL